MKNQNSDTFESTTRSEIERNNNFFTVAGDATNSPVFTMQESTRRLNDFDSKILEDDAYKDIESKSFQIEYKISRIEDNLKDIDIQIQTAKDMRDFNLVENLSQKKKMLIEEHTNLLQIYKETNISGKISDKITNILGLNSLKESLNSLFKVCVSILPKRFSIMLELQDSLNKLKNINKNVDELMSLKIPYGEDDNKYAQLSKYILKANEIQSEIAKQIKSK